MGFFGKLFSNEVKITDEKEAFVSILLSCVAADGELAQEEANSLIITLATREMFKGSNPGNLVKKAADNLKKLGSPSALAQAAIPAISAEKKASAFVYAVDIILADGRVTKEEEEILDFLKQNLSIDDSTASKVVEVLIMKNKI